MYIALTLLVVGAALALGAAPVFGPRALPWVRVAAVGAALGIIGLVLLPAAAAAIGAWTLPVVAAGMALPSIAERLLPRQHVAEETALLGLVAHQAIDGAQIAWLGPRDGLAVALSIALHGAALAGAAMVAATAAGRTAMAWTAGLLLGATGLGGLLGAAAAELQLEALEPWLRAAVSGLLLHAIAHAMGAHADGARGAPAAEQDPRAASPSAPHQGPR